MDTDEKILHIDTDTEIIEHEIDYYINMFCEEMKIDNISLISQSVFNAMMMYIYRHYFRYNDKLKDKTLYDSDTSIMKSTCNKYDMKYCKKLCEYYVYLCKVYDKEISIVGFECLTGIDRDTINSWGSDNRINVSDNGICIYKMLHGGREDSLSDKLVSGKVNPVGVLGVLNHFYNWAGVGNMEKAKPQVAKLEDVQKQAALLSDNSGKDRSLLPENSG